MLVTSRFTARVIIAVICLSRIEINAHARERSSTGGYGHFVFLPFTYLPSKSKNSSKRFTTGYTALNKTNAWVNSGQTFGKAVENIGFEPMTSCVQGRRSSQLS